MNMVTLRGRLVSDPQFKVSTNNEAVTSVAHFVLAVPNRRHKNAEGKFDADFIKHTAFNEKAEIAQNYLRQGSEIITYGMLHSYKYDKDGQTIYGMEILVDNIEFVSKCGASDDFSYMENINENELPFK